MENTILTAIVAEVRAEMQISPSIPDTVFTNYVKEGEQFLNHLAESLRIDFDGDLMARALLKNYVRYAYYGALADFKKAYQGDIYDTQIRYL